MRMRGLFVRRVILSQRLKQQRKPLCYKPAPPSNPTPSNNSTPTDFDPYKEVYNLDFEKALKIINSPNQRRRKFGLDFHLVQLFFTCLPSLAVYLVALYSRSEIKKYKAKQDEKARAEEEVKEKERLLEIQAAEEAVASNPVLVEVKGRLDKLEETIKDFVVESKRQSSNLEDPSKLEKSKQDPTPAKPSGSLDDKHSSSTATTKTSSNAEGDASKKGS